MKLKETFEKGGHQAIVFVGEQLLELINPAYEKIREADQENWLVEIFCLDYGGYKYIKAAVRQHLNTINGNLVPVFISTSIFVYREIEIVAKKKKIKVLWVDMNGNMGDIDDPAGVCIPHLDYELNQSDEYMEFCC